MGVILTCDTHPDAAQALVPRIEPAGGKAVALKVLLSQEAARINAQSIEAAGGYII